MNNRPLSELEYIIIHHTATPQNFSVEDIRRIHQNLGYCDVGYHFLIGGKQPTLQVGRDINYAGAHTIAEKIDEDMNRKAIGLSIIGDFSESDPSSIIINETAYAIKLLSKKYNIPLDEQHILPHKAVSYTACPGKNTFQLIWKKIKEK